MLHALLVLLLLIPAGFAAAETCSSSTLASATLLRARWCGDPPGTGTLRVQRRDGGVAAFRQVPLDVFRDFIRAQRAERFLASRIEGRFPAEPAPRDAPRPARGGGAG
jgi:hypothetical protein